MNALSIKLFSVTAIPLLVLAGCSTSNDTQPAVAHSECRPAEATQLIGKLAPTDTEAKALTGAKLIRKTTPNGAVTMDYSAQRLTITIDPKTNIVTNASCG